MPHKLRSIVLPLRDRHNPAASRYVWTRCDVPHIRDISTRIKGLFVIERKLRHSFEVNPTILCPRPLVEKYEQADRYLSS